MVWSSVGCLKRCKGRGLLLSKKELKLFFIVIVLSLSKGINCIKSIKYVSSISGV